MAVAVLALVGVLAGVAALADIWPFDDPELSRAELVARGDAVCERAREAFEGLQREPPRAAAQAAELTDRLVGIAEDEQEELESLNGPPDVQAALDRYLDAREEGLDALRAGRAAAEDRDAEAYAEARDELAAGQAERRRLAQEVGFSACSRRLRELR